MTKKKTFIKQKYSLDDMPIVKNKKGAKPRDHDPGAFFKHHEKVAEALLRSLENNDSGAFLEILDTYLYVNRTHIAKKARLSRTTVQNALSRQGNPTIKTIAKIVHRAVA